LDRRIDTVQREGERERERGREGMVRLIVMMDKRGRHGRSYIQVTVRLNLDGLVRCTPNFSTGVNLKADDEGCGHKYSIEEEEKDAY
jgi:hypothetical protein